MYYVKIKWYLGWHYEQKNGCRTERVYCLVFECLRSRMYLVEHYCLKSCFKIVLISLFMSHFSLHGVQKQTKVGHIIVREKTLEGY